MPQWSTSIYTCLNNTDSSPDTHIRVAIGAQEEVKNLNPKVQMTDSLVIAERHSVTNLCSETARLKSALIKTDVKTCSARTGLAKIAFAKDALSIRKRTNGQDSDRALFGLKHLLFQRKPRLPHVTSNAGCAYTSTTDDTSLACR
uniref:Uncharacterized protein n=1 Tax=Steinernema glaseri TaxID=37863 RepID=A0A1I8ABD8_9BILA